MSDSLPVQLETAGSLIDPTENLFVQDKRDDDLFDLCIRDAELLFEGKWPSDEERAQFY